MTEDKDSIIKKIYRFTSSDLMELTIWQKQYPVSKNQQGHFFEYTPGEGQVLCLEWKPDYIKVQTKFQFGLLLYN